MILLLFNFRITNIVNPFAGPLEEYAGLFINIFKFRPKATHIFYQFYISYYYLHLIYGGVRFVYNA